MLGNDQLQSSLIPFLTPAYSRSCELTCDNSGFFSAEKAVNGIVLLAAGNVVNK